jgi:hypothetical protein
MNKTKKQVLVSYDFGRGCKYLEQWFSGGIHAALQLLMTENSSLGYGGGDFQLERCPLELRSLIEPFIGLWIDDSIAFVGDYTQRADFVV